MNFVHATSNNNQMISNECLQNPSDCEDIQPAAENAQTAAVGLGMWDYVKMLFSLIFVLAILIFVLKFLNKKSNNYQQNRLVRNVGGITVGSQKSVQILHIGDKLYIVGVGEDVQLLKEIHDADEVQQLLEQYNEKQSLVNTTPYILDVFKKFNPKFSKTEKDESKTDFGEILNKKIADIKHERQNELEKWKEKERDR
ncbi:flagellar biosynthetic protein FliO [Ureibacillus xyleni]|nr:flagellar biosynthetic protein FliO [Ureibacillus xyleni]